MSFKDQTFSERFETMGDIAESAFEKYGPQAVRWGQDKTPFETFDWPEKYRYAPDYIGRHSFYEVQGCGRDQLFKFKLEKLSALKLWQFEFPVMLWLWDDANKRWSCWPLYDLLSQVRVLVPKQFPEGKEYFEIPVTSFGWTDTIG